MKETLLDMLKRHEGSNKNKDGRHLPYKCTGEKITIAYGRNLTDKGISEEEAMNMLVHDMQDALQDAYEIFPDFYLYSPIRRMAIVDMIFNLGKAGFLNFRKMIAAILNKDWGNASAEAVDSKWYTQVGSRGIEVARMLLEG